MSQCCNRNRSLAKIELMLNDNQKWCALARLSIKKENIVTNRGRTNDHMHNAHEYSMLNGCTQRKSYLAVHTMFPMLPMYRNCEKSIVVTNESDEIQ